MELARSAEYRKLKFFSHGSYHTSVLKTEGISSSEILVANYKTIWLHNSGDQNPKLFT
jgi:hypothetical protein